MADAYEVFVSYSHDSPDHIHAVLALSNRLRSEGIDCVLDQYEHSPPEGWPRWMEGKIASCRYVLMICTEAYNRRVMGTEAKQVGHGVRWEGHLIYQHLYDAGALNSKFIPVILVDSDRPFVPTPVRGATIYSMALPQGYDSLYARLAEIPPARPLLGPRRTLPAKPVRTNPILFVTSPIDFDLWNAAGWKAVFYATLEGGLPAMGLGFTDPKAARAIFEGWHERYGEDDKRDELRVAIVEGEIPQQHSGYSIHISTDTAVYIDGLKAAGFDYSEDILMSVGRVHRMNPLPGSPFLGRFKEEVRRSGTYYLVPGTVDGDGKVTMMADLRIRKRRIHFRNVSELGPKDVDSAVLLDESESR